LKVLIIGGGDGGIARELDQYSSVKEVVLCEIDAVRLSVLITFDSSCALSCYPLLTGCLCKVTGMITLEKCKGRVAVALALA